MAEKRGHHLGPERLAHFVIGEVHIGSGEGKEALDEVPGGVSGLAVVNTGHGHHREEAVGPEQGGQHAQVLKLGVSGLDDGLEDGPEAGEDGLQDRDDGGAPAPDEGRRVEVRLLVVSGDPVQELSEELHQVIGEHHDGGCFVLHIQVRPVSRSH